MAKETELKVAIREKTTAFQGYFRINAYFLRHTLHAGGWSEEMTREVFERGHAAGLLGYDPDRDEVLLIEQFRIGAFVANRPAWVTEIVAGIIEDGESPEDVVRRESVEEAGLEVGEIVPIADYLVSPGGTSETMVLFCGRMDLTNAGGIHGLDHEQEDIRVLPVPRKEAMDWLNEGRINNSMTLIALQWLMLNVEDLRKRWADR